MDTRAITLFTALRKLEKMEQTIGLERTFFIPVMGVHWRGPSFNNCGGGVVQENDVGRDSRYCLQSL